MHDINVLKNPNYDNIYTYIDRQVHNLTTDLDNRLVMKADKRDVENALPQRLEDLYRNIYSKVQDMKMEIARCATKEDLVELANTKADHASLRDLSSELSERTTRHEVHQTLLNNMKPVLQTMTSLEKQLQAQDHFQKTVSRETADRLTSIQSTHQEIVNSNLLPFLRNNNHNLLLQSSQDHVSSIVQNILQEKRLHELSPPAIQNMIANEMETNMKQTSLLCESMRLEIITTCREEFNQGKAVIQNKVDEAVQITNHTMDKLSKTRQAIKELSLNTAKALSKKLDRKEFQRGAVPRAEQVLTTSRALLSPSPQAHDSAHEFDYLMSSIRRSNERRDDSETESGQEDQEGVWEERKEEVRPRKTFSPAKSSRRRLARTTETAKASSHGVEAQQHRALRQEMADLRHRVDKLSAMATALQAQQQSLPPAPPAPAAAGTAPNRNGQQQVIQQEMEKLDWRLALGDLGMNLRREMADKISREEVYSALHSESTSAEKRLSVSSTFCFASSRLDYI